MPIATVIDSQQRFDLQTCPEGYVIIRRMTFGERLKRTSMMSKMTMEMPDRRSGNNNPTAEFEMFQEKVTAWEFSNLILEHNLTDEKGTLLNFKNVADVQRISSQIGDEISRRINEINDFEELPEVKN